MIGTFVQKYSLRELRVIERGIEAALRHKLVMVARLGNGAVLYNEDGICVLYGGEAVRDNEARAALHKRCHSLLNFDLGARVYV